MPTNTHPTDETPVPPLVAAYDDPADPSEVTLFPTGVADATRWLTIDLDTAVPLVEAV